MEVAHLLTKGSASKRTELKEETKMFDAFRASETFRARRTGFTDVILEYKICDLYSSRCERMRVSAHWALIVTHGPDIKPATIDAGEIREKITVYSKLKPLICKPHKEMDIYRLADVDHLKQVILVTRRLEIYIQIRDRTLARRIKTFKDKYSDRNPASVEKAVNRTLEAIETLTMMDREIIRLLEEDVKVTDIISPAEARRLYGEQAEKNLGLSFERVRVASRLRLQGKK